MLKTILFDLDGTLCQLQGNFSEIFLQACMPIFEANLNHDQVFLAWKEVLKIEGPLNSKSALEHLCRCLFQNIEFSCEEMGRRLCQDYAANIIQIDGAIDALQFLSGQFKLGLITNGPFDMQNAAIDALGIRGLFERIIISGDTSVKIRKPSPKIFQIALEAMQSWPEETLMIGDNFEIDLLIPQSMGMQTVLLNHNRLLDQCRKNPTKQVDSFTALLTLIQCDFHRF